LVKSPKNQRKKKDVIVHPRYFDAQSARDFKRKKSPRGQKQKTIAGYTAQGLGARREVHEGGEKYTQKGQFKEKVNKTKPPRIFSRETRTGDGRATGAKEKGEEAGM